MARPLQKTYSPTHPYAVQRIDHDHGGISYEIIDERPDSYRIVCWCHEDEAGDRMQAKRDADMIVRALNLMNHAYPVKTHKR